MKLSNTFSVSVGLSCCGLLLGAAAGAFGAAQPLVITLAPIGTYNNGAPYNAATAKVVAHDPVTQRVYLANERDTTVDVLDIHNPSQPIRVATLDMTPYGAVVNGAACRDGLTAVAIGNEIKTSRGKAVFFDRNFQVVSVVPVGALPDFIVFSPDGRWVLVANEGEPNTYNDEDEPSIDPEGSVTVIDFSAGVATPTVRTATFGAFNGMALNPDIRVYGPNATVAQDLEPESIAVSGDSTTAYVTLQENNAMAIVDIASATVTQLVGLGYKDHSVPGNGLDASDRDSAINIANWPVWGVYMPDEIAAYRYQGQTFLVMANEGDTRDYPGFTEEARVSSLTLDETIFPNAADLKQNMNLGRLTVSTVNADPDGDGDIDVLFSTGGRSFSIRAATGELVFDSGDEFEQLTAALYPATFNASNSNNSRDDRSDNKGPEPEGVVVGRVAGRVLAFIGFERIGGVVVYDISNPFDPFLVDYINTRTFANPFSFPTAGDLGPEGLKFISAEDSPNGKPLLLVANEVSGSVTVLEINHRSALARQ